MVRREFRDISSPTHAILPLPGKTKLLSTLHPKVEKPIRIFTEDILSGILVTIAIFFYGHLALLISGKESS
jgi:hypothetical protein